MAHRIESVSGPAKRAGILPGDELLAVDGTAVIDLIDYQFLMAKRNPALKLRRGSAAFEKKLRKGEYEDAGLVFAPPTMLGTRCCCNKCVFCFVDQLPKNVRESMRIKDDDWRMSLIMGNYVTLTNVPEAGIRRIVARHASPLYISVHATDPELRAHVLGTPRAKMLMDQLSALSAGGIHFHTQCVLCPGLNDGAALEKTISDLVSLMPAALSLALVPVGLTAHREGLSPLRPYARDEARNVLDMAEKWRKRLLSERGTRFVFPSDEFYLIAGRELPSDAEYEEYGQVDDGVGMLRLLESEYALAWAEKIPGVTAPEKPVRLIAACGKSAADFLAGMFARYPIPGVEITVRALTNGFFGDTVTVSGLITGGDLLSQLSGADCDGVLITETMLNSGGDRFLDDMTLPEVREKLGLPILPVNRHGDGMLDDILNFALPGAEF